VPPASTRWRPQAVLRPGLPVTLLNISVNGALVESPAWLRPGARTELQLEAQVAQVLGIRRRHSVRGHLDRCQVVALNPVSYHGVIVFDERLDLDANAGSE
jgi:hypothetical protein